MQVIDYISEVNLGLSCPKSDACLTTNAVCSGTGSNAVCVCYTGFYDSNGGTDGGNCIQSKHLSTEYFTKRKNTYVRIKTKKQTYYNAYINSIGIRLKFLI